MIETILIILIIVLLLGFSIAGYFFYQRLKEISQSKDKDIAMGLLNQNIQGLQDRIDQTTRSLNERLDVAAQVIGSVGKELGQVQEIGRNLKDFQDFLHSPKLRGNIGEQILADTLKQSFPQAYYQLQYSFTNGYKVDAAIKIGAGIVPVDAKCPMENFRLLMKAENDDQAKSCRRDFIRDVKKHIDDISSKYIQPDEGTVDFAIMYIPTENVYYEITANTPELMEYSRTRKIAISSPDTFYHFLQTVMLGLKERRISEMSHKILELLNTIQKETTKLGDSLSVLNKHVNNSKNTLDTINSHYTRLLGKVDSVKLLELQNDTSDQNLIEGS